MADDIPDLNDIEEYEDYEARYADDFDMMDNEEGNLLLKSLLCSKVLTLSMIVLPKVKKARDFFRLCKRFLKSSFYLDEGRKNDDSRNFFSFKKLIYSVVPLYFLIFHDFMI